MGIAGDPLKTLYIYITNNTVIITDITSRHIKIEDFLFTNIKITKPDLKLIGIDFTNNPNIHLRMCKHLWVLLDNDREIIIDNEMKDIRLCDGKSVLKIVYNNEYKITNLLKDDVPLA